MTAPVSQITIDDGTTQIDISGYATLELTQEFRPVRGGSTITRFQDGTAVKQQTFRKTVVRLRGRGWAPPELESLDYSAAQTWTIQSNTGNLVISVFADPPDEEWQINAAAAIWSLTGEEI